MKISINTLLMVMSIAWSVIIIGIIVYSAYKNNWEHAVLMGFLEVWVILAFAQSWQLDQIRNGTPINKILG
jgi:hypothetical protein